MKKIALFAAATVFAFTIVAEATMDSRPIWVGLGTHKEGNIDITGFRLNLPYSYNDTVTGFDLGVIGSCTYMWGFQLNLVGNIVRDRAGAWQLGLYNDVRGVMTGLQLGAWNNARCGEGVQAGLLNLSDEFYGLQIGLINRANYLYGVQVGAVNVIRGSPVPFMPFINIGF